MSNVCAAVFAVLVAATPARAQWPASGRPLATGPTQQSRPLGLTGPHGELYAFWVEVGAPQAALRAQHLTRAGTLETGWSEGGRVVVTTPAAIALPMLSPDGAGGTLLAWYDYRSSGGPRGIYAVRADHEASVATGWLASGTAVCTSTNAQGLGPLNDLVALCGDGAGGAFIAWTDARNTPPASLLIYDVFAQHVLADGSLDPAWPAAGLGMTTGPGYKYPHVLLADGAGGFWLVTENSNATERIAASHRGVDGAEIARWTSPAAASRAAAVSDGAGGIVLTWYDCRDCLSGSDGIYAVRLDPGATPVAGWPAGGVVVAASPQDDNLPVIVPTGAEAAMIAWLHGGAGPDAYMARRLEFDGSFAPAWQAGGVAVATSNDILSGWPFMVSDGDGGAMFAFRRNTPNVFGSRVDAGATVPAAFPDTGLSLCSLAGDQFPSALVSDGVDGAYVLWEDRRDEGTNSTDVYAARFTRDGAVGPTVSVAGWHPSARLELSAPRPNPSSSLSRFDLVQPEAAAVILDVLDPAGRIVATLHDGWLPAGRHALEWRGRDARGGLLPPGVYLVRVRGDGASAVRRIVRFR